MDFAKTATRLLASVLVLGTVANPQTAAALQSAVPFPSRATGSTQALNFSQEALAESPVASVVPALTGNVVAQGLRHNAPTRVRGSEMWSQRFAPPGSADEGSRRGLPSAGQNLFFRQAPVLEAGGGLNDLLELEKDTQELEPKNRPNPLRALHALTRTAQWSAAIDYFEKSVERDERLSPETQMLAMGDYALALTKAGRFADAKAQYLALWQTIPYLRVTNEAMDFYSLKILIGLLSCITLVDVHKKKTPNELAEDTYRREVETRATLITLENDDNLTGLQIAGGLYKQAAFLEHRLPHSPSNARKLSRLMSQIHQSIGQLLLQAQTFRAAEREFRLACALNPSNVESWGALHKVAHLARLAQGDHDDAAHFADVVLWDSRPTQPGYLELQNMVRAVLHQHQLDSPRSTWLTAHYRVGIFSDEIVLAVYNAQVGLERTGLSWVLTPSAKRPMTAEGPFELTYQSESQRFAVSTEKGANLLATMTSDGSIELRPKDVALQDIELNNSSAYLRPQDPRAQDFVRGVLKRHGFDPESYDWTRRIFRRVEAGGRTVLLAYKGFRGRQLTWIFSEQAAQAVEGSASDTLFPASHFEVTYLPANNIFDIRSFPFNPLEFLQRFWILPDGRIEEKTVSLPTAAKALGLAGAVVVTTAALGVGLVWATPFLGLPLTRVVFLIATAWGTALSVLLGSAGIRMLYALRKSDPETTIRNPLIQPLVTPDERHPAFDFLHPRLQASLDGYLEGSERGGRLLRARFTLAQGLLRFYPLAIVDIAHRIRKRGRHKIFTDLQQRLSRLMDDADRLEPPIWPAEMLARKAARRRLLTDVRSLVREWAENGLKTFAVQRILPMLLDHPAGDLNYKGSLIFADPSRELECVIQDVRGTTRLRGYADGAMAVVALTDGLERQKYRRVSAPPGENPHLAYLIKERPTPLTKGKVEILSTNDEVYDMIIGHGRLLEIHFGNFTQVENPILAGSNSSKIGIPQLYYLRREAPGNLERSLDAQLRKGAELIDPGSLPALLASLKTTDGPLAYVAADTPRALLSAREVKEYFDAHHPFVFLTREGSLLFVKASLWSGLNSADFTQIRGAHRIFDRAA